MACYIMKALTHDKSWFEFTMEDLPMLHTTDEFVLLGKPNSPIMYANSIRRGDYESRLYEGDVIEMDGHNWVICYERGFYAINHDYVVRYLYQLSDYKFIGTCSEIETGIPINFRTRHLFTYKHSIFRLDGITGAYKGKLILRSISGLVNAEDIRQECCIKYKDSRVYLGDTIDGGVVELHGGRVTLNKGGKLIDMATGGELNGYITESAGRS